MAALREPKLALPNSLICWDWRGVLSLDSMDAKANLLQERAKFGDSLYAFLDALSPHLQVGFATLRHLGYSRTWKTE
jgi:hypothetical protein